MITPVCQRWELGRESRRPAGEVIAPREYDVAAIDGSAARAFVREHHYAGSCSPPAHPFGLFRRGELAGVAVFGPLPSMNAHRAVFPTLSTTEAFTLGRLVLLDAVPGNGESFFVSRCFALLRAQGVVAIESSSDPEAHRLRRSARVPRACRVCLPGHKRPVRRAHQPFHAAAPTGWPMLLEPRERQVVRGEQGRAYAGSELVAFGAEPLNDGEDPTTWLVRWRDALTRAQRHHGNHRYLWVLDDRRRRELTPLGPERAYPKIGWS